MNVEFFQIGPIGDLVIADAFGWVTVEIGLPATEAGAHPSVSIKVPVQYERDWTVDRVREKAFEMARATIADVSALLAEHTLAGLVKADMEKANSDQGLG